MYTLVRRFIKTGIAFLAAGLMIGTYMIVGRELLGRHPSPWIASAHAHAILGGFVMLMIMGVALWLFPRPDRSDEHYRPRVAELAYWIVTLATVARVGGELLRPQVDALWLRWVVVLGGAGQAAGILLFFYTIWSRIRPVGSQVREGRGERF